MCSTASTMPMEGKKATNKKSRKVAELEAEVQESKAKVKNLEAQVEAFKAQLQQSVSNGADVEDAKAASTENGLHAATAKLELQAQELHTRVQRTGDALQSCIDDPKCNPAKCAGDEQDNSVLRGGLDCKSNPTKGVGKQGRHPVIDRANVGSNCLDNLSAGMFYAAYGPVGTCVSFNSKEAGKRRTDYSFVEGDPRDGTITKLIIAHQHLADLQYGVIVGKRMRCVGSSCYVYKQGYCIKCPRKVFRRKSEDEANRDDFSKFYNCCIKGATHYFHSHTGEDKICDSAFRNTDEGPPGAFTEINSANAMLKPSYRCWDGIDETDSAGKKAQEVGDAVMKAA